MIEKALVWEYVLQNFLSDSSEGINPVPSTSASAAAPGATSPSPEVKMEPLDENDSSDLSKVLARIAASGKIRKHNQRVDKSYILPRPDHVIVRRQQNLVCQLCHEGGFVTCSSIDFHIRKVHKAGIHQAGMWLHCARCAHDFCNISSVRTHVGGESCDWQNIFMCWHERKEENGMPVVGDDVAGGMEGLPSTSLVANLQEVNATPMPKRHRKLFKPPSQAEAGFTIVKRNTNIPCFGCSSHCSSMTTFIWHMQGKHRIYFSDIGAWMECACGREFTSTTALRVHLREDGVETGCLMVGVSLCWQQRVGGRETETPCFSGVPTPLDRQYSLWARGSTEEDRDNDIYDPTASGVVKEEMHDIKIEEAEEITPGANNEISGNDLFDSSFYPTTSGFVKEEEEEGDHSLMMNEEEGAEMEEAGISRTGAIEEVNNGRRLATFDPTGYEDGDRFVLRKTALMTCRSCGVLRASPNELAAHLQLEHEEEMRGMRRDWQEQQWLECATCRSIFHAASDHEQHLLQSEQACSMADARLCWMEKVEMEKDMTASH